MIISRRVTPSWLRHAFVVTRRLNASLVMPGKDEGFKVAPTPAIGVAFALHDTSGSLVEALSIFSKKGISLSHVSNRCSPLEPYKAMFHVHFRGSWESKETRQVLDELRPLTLDGQLFKIAAPDVPWFPRHISDLDQFSKSTLDAGDDLQSDHPGFTDPDYRARRAEIAKIASEYRGADGPVPHIDYTDQEVATWGCVWDKLTKLYPNHACKEHNDALKELVNAGIYGPRKIPQLSELSEFVSARTGFQFRPVTGLLSGRDFLNALAFRVFFSTQYIRHHSAPMYTPEPDVIHELLGHAPMFLNPDFADFTQYIGLASLGASDEVIKKLATCYWFSVEFGLLVDFKGAVKAYGAGVLSSYGELLHATSPTNTEIAIKEWDPEEAANQDYPITTMQPVYFAARSMEDAKIKMKAYCDRINRPFHCMYDAESENVFTDVDVYTRPVGMNDIWKIVGNRVSRKPEALLTKAALRGWRKYVNRKRLLWRNRIVVSARGRFRYKRDVMLGWYGYTHSEEMMELRRRREEFIKMVADRHHHLAASAMFSAWVSLVYRGKMKRLRNNRAEAYAVLRILEKAWQMWQHYTSDRTRLASLECLCEHRWAQRTKEEYIKRWQQAADMSARIRKITNNFSTRMKQKRGIKALRRAVLRSRHIEEIRRQILCAKARAVVIDLREWTRERSHKRMNRALARKMLTIWRSEIRRKIKLEDSRHILESLRCRRLKRSACENWLDLTRKEISAARYAVRRLLEIVWAKWTCTVKHSCVLAAFLTWRERLARVPRELARVRLRRAFGGWLLRCVDMKRSERQGIECRNMHDNVMKLSVLLKWQRLRLLWEVARRMASGGLKRRALIGWKDEMKIRKLEKRRDRKIGRILAERSSRIHFYGWHDLCRVSDFRRVLEFRRKRKFMNLFRDLVEDRKYWRQLDRGAGGKYFTKLIGASMRGMQMCVAWHRRGREEAKRKLARSLCRKWFGKWIEVLPILRCENSRWMVAVKLSCEVLMGRGFRGLKEFKMRRMSEKDQVRRAQVVVMKLRALQSLAIWRGWKNRRKIQWQVWQIKSSTIAAAGDAQKLRSTFLYWKNDYLHYAKLKHILRNIATKFNLLMEWRRLLVGVEIVRGYRERLEGILGRRRVQTLSRFFNLYREAVTDSLIVRYNNSRALLHWADNLSSQVWRYWVEYLNIRKSSQLLRRKSDDFLRGRLTCKIFRVFRSFSSSQRTCRLAVGRIKAIKEVRLLRGYLICWSKSYDRNLRVKAGLEGFETSRSRRTQLGCLLQWRQMVHQMCALRNVGDILKRRILQFGFVAMRRAIEEMRRQESITVKVAYRWRRFVRHRRQELQDEAKKLNSEREREIWSRLEEIKYEINRLRAAQGVTGG